MAKTTVSSETSNYSPDPINTPTQLSKINTTKIPALESLLSR